MKFTAEIDGEPCTLDVRREGEQIIAEIDNRRPYTFKVREVDAGVYLLLGDDHHVYECRVDNLDAESGTVNVSIGNRRVHSVRISDAKRLPRGGVNAAAHGGGQSKIVAAMPGKIVRVLVEAGAQVEVGDGIIVVEAMKMQNEMKAARAGTVTSIHAQAGEIVNAGDVLIVIE